MTSSIVAGLVLIFTAACSTSIGQPGGNPAASPMGGPQAGTMSAEQERCVRDSGTWRDGRCNHESGGGGY